MKPIVTSIIAGAYLICGALFAQNTKTTESAPKAKSDATEASSDKSTLNAEELEAKFKETLSKATLSGRWCSIKNGDLGEEKADKYTINSVAKISGDTWVINARIQYGQRDIIAPIPVKVKWAGDTPVIIVDKVGIPGGSVYSARVMIFEKTYAGTWTGGDHGGLLNGIITNQKN
jgi:hypothetical protein